MTKQPSPLMKMRGHIESIKASSAQLRHTLKTVPSANEQDLRLAMAAMTQHFDMLAEVVDTCLMGLLHLHGEDVGPCRMGVDQNGDDSS